MDIFKNLKKYEFFRLPPFALLCALFIFCMGVLFVFNLLPVWENRQDYSFGYLIPVFALYVLYDRSAQIYAGFNARPIEVGGRALQISNILFNAVFFLSALFFVFGIFLKFFAGAGGAPEFAMGVGFSFMAFTCAYLASERNCGGQKLGLKQRLGLLKYFIFPAFIWIVSTPLVSPIEDKISIALLGRVTVIVYNIMDVLGCVAEVHGNVISFPNGSVGVADACSGIRSLTACLVAGSFLAAVSFDKFWKKLALVACAMVLAFINNIFRALFLALWAYENGSDSIDGAVHDIAGYAVLGITIVGLLFLIPLFQISAVPKELRDAENPEEVADDSDRKN